jgi:hypothetical protein
VGHAQAAEAFHTLEHGSISFLARPRVEEPNATELGDVQRLLLLLAPSGSAYQRLVAVGRKRLPRSARRDRFWGFIDLVLTEFDMQAALDSQVYGTKTRGLRHLPAARAIGEGTYEITRHDGHAHLSWSVTNIAQHEPLASEIEIEEEADYIVTVANPDPGAWGLVEPPDLQTALFDDLELHVPLPTPFPTPLQQRFRNRRFVQLDSIEWLDHPGAELVFVGAGE